MLNVNDSVETRSLGKRAKLNAKPVGNIKAITVALTLALTLVGLLSAGSVNSVHGVSNTTVTVDAAPSVRVQDLDGVHWYQAVDSSAPKNHIEAVFGCPGTTDMGVVAFPSAVFPIRVKVLDCKSKVVVAKFENAGSQSQAGLNLGPSTSAVLIHEFNDETAEAAAFGAGSLDLMDWSPPSSFVNNWTQPVGLVATNKASLSKFTDISGVFQIDINNWKYPTNNRALRQALGYLVDRQQIVNVFADGLAVPVCAATAPGQPGAMSCNQLGYPISFGDFNPAKAIQVLYEGGWRDSNNNGVLEAPGGGEPTLIFYVRLDDSIRRQAGDQLTQALLHMPKQVVSKAGPVQTVCPATSECKINIDERVLPGNQISPIVFRATGINLWNLYTGSLGVGFDPEQLAIYTSRYAWAPCGGGWSANTGAVNYVCYADPNYDCIIPQPDCVRVPEPPPYDEFLGDVRAAQQYLWGYGNCPMPGPGSTPGKICGTMPTIPMYSRSLQAVAYNNDRGANPIVGAQWKGWVGQEVGVGMGQLAANIAEAGLYNGQTGGAGYASYRGQGVLDWGFKNSIEHLNPVFTDWLWDSLAMQQTYDSCLMRNPVQLAEIVPSMCENFGQTEVFNTALGKQTTVGVYKFQDGLFWSDGVAVTADDFKFSIEYVQKNQGTNFYLVSDVLKIDVIGADASMGLGGTAIAYFDDVGLFFMRDAGFLPIIPKHVWCPSWPDITTDCPYPDAFTFPDFDFSKHVGTGPFVLDSCTGTSCNETITLKANPFYTRGSAYWDAAYGIQLQPDVNRDDRVNQADLDLLNTVNPTDPTFDVDYRIQTVGPSTYTSTVTSPTATFTVYESGPLITDNDRYIVNRLMYEGITRGGDPSGLVWPTAHTILTHVWPDATRDNTVDVDDLIQVYLHQFQNPKAGVPPGANNNAIDDVDYSGDISVDDLITVYVRQFTKPVGVP